MLKNFQLAAIVRESSNTRLLHIPLHQELQSTLAEIWQEQYNAFMADAEEVMFDPGFQHEENERPYLPNYEPPKWLAEAINRPAHLLDDIPKDDAWLDDAKGIAAFAREKGKDVILLQNFNRSHVIQPGRFLFLEKNTYVTAQRPGLTLDSKLSAVYKPDEQKLLFRKFRAVNAFLPLADYYPEASDQQIRDILSHKLLAPEDVDALVRNANQWSRKRFAMLRNSDVLTYPAGMIKERSVGYDIDIRVSNEKIVFPAEKKAAKKLLQFLNEELFRGAITNQLYETNSKRKASER